MQIGILTYYSVHNHGAVLQAYALRKVLENKGHRCGFLEFKRDYSNIPKEHVDKYRLGFGSVKFYARYLISRGLSNVLYNIVKKYTLSRFRHNNIPLIAKCENFEGDLVVIGSDEVFSLEIGINPVLYGNGLRANHVISYAACFGPTTYSDVISSGQSHMIAEGLHRMDAISVRDKNSMEIVKKVTGINAFLVCDPVILYGYEKEIKSFLPPYENYVLIYSYDKNFNDSKEYNCVKEYAVRHKLKVVSVGYQHNWCENINATPIELLGWIKNAGLVVTDTFHGAVVSIICNADFVVKLRENGNKLGFLLSEYGLSDRALSSFEDFDSIAGKHIDYKDINSIVLERRTYSLRYLDMVLRNAEDK